MTFGVFFRADDEFEVKFASSPFSLQENKILKKYKESDFPERGCRLYMNFKVFSRADKEPEVRYAQYPFRLQ